MKNLQVKIEENKLVPILNLSKIKVYRDEVNLSNQPDFDISSYDGLSEKEYPLDESIDISEEYIYLFHAELESVENRADDEVFDLENSEYFIRSLNKRERKIEFKGKLVGDSFDIGSDHYETVASLKLIGLRLCDADDLNIYQELILEGYLLELEKNYKMSFFTYFTAIDSFVNDRLDAIKESTFSELNDCIDYLSLKDKIRILVKFSLNTTDLNSLKIWSTFSGLIKELTEIRNSIAHGKPHTEVSCEMVSRSFLLLAILVCIIKHKLDSFIAMRKQLC
jgi:hypothetical protein